MQHQQHVQRSPSQPALLILASLLQGPKHAAGLCEAIEQTEGLFFEPATLYRVLAQLEQRGWIEALTTEHPLRLYSITALGIRTLQRAEAGSQGEMPQEGGYSLLLGGKKIIMRLVIWMLRLLPIAAFILLCFHSLSLGGWPNGPVWGVFVASMALLAESGGAMLIFARKWEIGTVFHSMSLAVILVEQAAYSATGAAQASLLHLQTMLLVFRLPLAAFFGVCYLVMWSIVVVTVLRTTMCYPKWIVLFVPALLSLAIAGVGQSHAVPVLGNVLYPTILSLPHLVFFSLSTLVLWNANHFPKGSSE